VSNNNNFHREPLKSIKQLRTNIFSWLLCCSAVVEEKVLQQFSFIYTKSEWVGRKKSFDLGSSSCFTLKTRPIAKKTLGGS
jgi:hypothetical protein